MYAPAKTCRFKRMKGKRDRALLALLLACGLRRHEAVSLRLEHRQQREDHWAIVDLLGKGRYIRTVPIPDWVVAELNEWLKAAEINRGRISRKVNKTGHIWGDSMTEKAVWHVVKECAKRIGVAKLAPHDLRRTCAKLCQASGGEELEQIQFLLEPVLVQTTERYLACKQRIRSGVNDRIGIEPRLRVCQRFRIFGLKSGDLGAGLLPAKRRPQCSVRIATNRPERREGQSGSQSTSRRWR
jgi:integrase